MARPAHEAPRGNKVLTESGFEKRGGYPSTGPVVSVMPKAPAGPAPGSSSSATAQPSSSTPQE